MEQERPIGRGVDRLDDARQRRSLGLDQLRHRARLIAHQMTVEREPLDLRERAQHAALHQPAHHRAAGADRAGELAQGGRPAERRQVVDHRAPLRGAAGRFELPIEVSSRELDGGAVARSRAFAAGHRDVARGLESFERLGEALARKPGGEVADGGVAAGDAAPRSDRARVLPRSIGRRRAWSGGRARRPRPGGEPAPGRAASRRSGSCSSRR